MVFKLKGIICHLLYPLFLAIQTGQVVVMAKLAPVTGSLCNLGSMSTSVVTDLFVSVKGGSIMT